MKYLSVCSGIEAATVAWHPLGWTPVAFSEIEKFPSEVLKHHYPQVPNVGDMTKFKEWNLDSNVDVFVGGTPCQSFSVAGLRKGLDDPRGNLMLTYLAIADKYRPRWLVWENVFGVLSSNGGLDFASLLRGMGECGYGFAYRILDAQYFGVAQRRRRVFVVGCLGDWRSAAAVLFERHSLSGHPAPSREKRKDSSEGIAQCFEPRSPDGHARLIGEFSPTLNRMGGGQREPCVIQPIALAENTIGRLPENGGNGDGFADGGPMYTLNATGVHGVAQPISFDMAQITSKANGTRVESGLPVSTLAKGSQMHVAQPIAFTTEQTPKFNNDQAMTLTSTQYKRPQCVTQPTPFGISEQPNVGHCLRAGASMADKHESTTYVAQQMAVRRLTPKECERLQGFPDNYTDIKLKGKPTPDGPRYKALGNSMAVPVMAWIGKRIQEVENIRCKPNK